MKWHGAWLYGVHRTCAETAAVSCGTSHASAVSTPLRWIFHKKTRYKASHSCRTTCERSESAQESGEWRYISNHQSIKNMFWVIKSETTYRVSITISGKNLDCLNSRNLCWISWGNIALNMYQIRWSDEAISHWLSSQVQKTLIIPYRAVQLN